MNPDYPSFDVAEQRFRAFLSQEGVAASELFYITPDDVALIGHRVFVRQSVGSARGVARSSYEDAVAKSRGVLLAAFCALDDSVCAYIFGSSPESVGRKWCTSSSAR
ncbi:MAG: hypothetical protein WD069_10885, partial [Planctomycetales bacterium]